MAVYFITGKLGSGKTLVTVGKIRDYLRKGKPVATNLDLNIEKLTHRNSKSTFYRLPDKPRPEDLELIGKGSESVDEETFGLLVLDECGTWLNSRSWNDKERRLFIDWMLHARKLGWDILFIIQDISIIDKQLKMTLCEHLVVCRRLDRMKIPWVSSLLKYTLGLRVTMPKIHTAKVFYGDSETDYLTDRWTYTGKDLYSAYDTRQVFHDDVLHLDDAEVDLRATYSSLSSWHLVGRYYQRPKFKFTNPLQLLLFPTWLFVVLLRSYVASSARRSGLAS